jgi:hypothetical protein
MEVDPILFGRVLERLDAQDKLINEIRSDLRTLVDLANKGRGAWWLSLTLVGAIMTGLGWVVSRLPFGP